jgi:sec-independent protein translocase protein TatA
MGALSWWHILLVVLVALLLFGGKRLPEAARGLGRSMRILKSEVGAMSEDSKKDDDVTYRADTTVAQPAPITPTPLPPASAQPIPPAQPINQAPKITVNGRPVDRTP